MRAVHWPCDEELTYCEGKRMADEGGTDRITDLLAPELQSVDLARFMREALAQAEAAGQAGELPIGAVLVVAGEAVSRGRNANQASHSQLRHAEMNALLDGGPMLWERYREAILFTTVEPCPMCLGAAVMADVAHIIFSVS